MVTGQETIDFSPPPCHHFLNGRHIMAFVWQGRPIQCRLLYSEYCNQCCTSLIDNTKAFSQLLRPRLLASSPPSSTGFVRSQKKRICMGRNLDLLLQCFLGTKRIEDGGEDARCRVSNNWAEVCGGLWFIMIVQRRISCCFFMESKTLVWSPEHSPDHMHKKLPLT